MLDRLLETAAVRRTPAWGGTLSVILHGAIIALAVVATAHAAPEKRDGSEKVHRMPLVPPGRETPVGKSAGNRGHQSRSPLSAPTLPPISVPGPIDIDASVPVPTGMTGADTSVLHDIGRGNDRQGSALGSSSAVSDATVDSPVRVVDERIPAYPEALRSAGITGTVSVQFVVDTAGRVEASSVRVIASSHELFTRAVLASLRQARFTPGEVAGHAVRTLVERSFRFDIAGAR